MSSPLAMMLGYTTYAAAYDPIVDLPNLLWFVHTDDSTTTPSKVSAINDRVAAYAFAQGTDANRPLANTTEKPGHTVWEFANTGRRFLSRSDATLAGTLDGSPACTLGVFARVVDSGSDGDFSGHTSNTTSYAKSIRHRTNDTALAGTYLWREEDSGVGATNYQSAVEFPSGWNLLTGVSDGAGSLEFFANGVSQDTISGTHRAPTGMTFVTLGEALANSVATKSVFIGGLFCCTGQLSAANQVLLATWFAGSFA